MPSDAKNGPLCKVFGIHGADVHGVRTWILNLEFMTWVNNCLDQNSPIISHRWEKNIDYDEKYRAIITTRGKVVFHAGRLWQANQSVDFYREEFFQPPPAGFAVAHLNVNVDSSNCEAEYTVIHEERFYGLGQYSPALEVEAMCTSGFVQGSVTNGLAQSAPMVGQWAAGFLPWNWFSAPNTMQMAGNVSANMQSQLPKYWASITVRAHGARQSARLDLYRLCMAVAFARLGAPDWFGTAYRTSVVASQSLHDNYTEVDMKLAWTDQIYVQLSGVFGPLGSIATTVGLTALGGGNGMNFVNSFFMINSAAPTAQNPLGNDTTIPTNQLSGGADPLLNEAGGNDGAGRLRLLTQIPSVGNRPMYGQRFPPNAAIQAVQNSRTPGYLRYVLTQALMGQCSVPSTTPQDQPIVLGQAPPTVPSAAAANPILPPA